MQIPIVWLLVVSQAAAVPAEPFSSPVDLGDEVRLIARSASPQALHGRVAAQDDAGLTVTRATGGQRVTVPWPEIRNLEIARVRERSHGALGALAGLVTGVALMESCEDPDWFFRCEDAYPYVVAGTVATGALVGYMIRTRPHTWERAYHPRLTAGIAPTRGRGAAVALTLRF
jgi:hypothetical protein